MREVKLLLRVDTPADLTDNDVRELIDSLIGVGLWQADKYAEENKLGEGTQYNKAVFALTLGIQPAVTLEAALEKLLGGKNETSQSVGES